MRVLALVALTVLCAACVHRQVHCERALLPINGTLNQGQKS